MRLKFQVATAADAPDITLLRNAASAHLTSQFGKGVWSGNVTDKARRPRYFRVWRASHCSMTSSATDENVSSSFPYSSTVQKWHF